MATRVQMEVEKIETGKVSKKAKKKLTYEEYMTKHRRRKYKRRRRRGGVLCCFYLLLDKVITVLQSSPEEYIPVKTLLGFPIGAFLAFLLYKAVIEPLSLPPNLREIVGAFLGLGLASGYAMSIQVRCITWLLVPTFFGKKGRSFVAAYAIIFLIAGPVHNIMVNGKEVMRALVCATELAINHTATKMELKSDPFKDIAQDFQKQGKLLKVLVQRVSNAYQPLKKEFQDNEKEEKEMEARMRKVDKTSRGRRGKDRMRRIEDKNNEEKAKDRQEKAEKKYRKKLEMRCEDVWNNAVVACVKKFEQKWDECLDRLPIIGYYFCLPLQLTFFCEIVRVIPGAFGMACDSMDVMEPGFGETYVAADDTMDAMDNNFDVNMQYKVAHSPEDVDYTMAEEVRKEAMHEFNKKQTVTMFFMSLLQRMLAFTFILVFISSYKYNKKYLSNFNFDNVYITPYFRHIDARRFYQGKRKLLPLKKFEKCNVVFPKTLKLMKSEKKKLSKGTFLLIMRGLVSGLVIISAKLLYEVMDIIEKNSHITYRQQGIHHIAVHVGGTGFMSDIVRLFLDTFNRQKNVDTITTNFECLPHGTPLPIMDIIRIYAVYIAVWFLMLFQSYGLRLRRVVCSFFYRKREKKRTLFMYNEMLKRRKGFLKHLRKKVRKEARRLQLTRDTSALLALKRLCPRLEVLLKCCKGAKLKCLVCEDVESKKQKFVPCPTPGCNFTYCPECWLDCRETCYACLPFGKPRDFSDSDTSNDGSTDDEDDE
uniref:DC-STAMP domain-containing protein 1-like n=1 Tax=Crassostrea virginica TaxID=6565 RepID=A0A8B8C382_CRAVI|nr:DC-STAMP domain-containing protein 1-like [Crassostrea virginica]